MSSWGLIAFAFSIGIACCMYLIGEIRYCAAVKKRCERMERWAQNLMDDGGDAE